MWIQKYRKKIDTETDSGILKKDAIQVSYDRWSGVVQNKKNNFQVKSKKGYHASKCTEKKAERANSKHRTKCMGSMK